MRFASRSLWLLEDLRIMQSNNVLRYVDAQAQPLMQSNVLSEGCSGSATEDEISSNDGAFEQRPTLYACISPRFFANVPACMQSSHSPIEKLDFDPASPEMTSHQLDAGDKPKHGRFRVSSKRRGPHSQTCRK